MTHELGGNHEHTKSYLDRVRAGRGGGLLLKGRWAGAGGFGLSNLPGRYRAARVFQFNMASKLRYRERVFLYSGQNG